MHTLHLIQKIGVIHMFPFELYYIHRNQPFPCSFLLTRERSFKGNNFNSFISLSATIGAQRRVSVIQLPLNGAYEYDNSAHAELRIRPGRNLTLLKIRNFLLYKCELNTESIIRNEWQLYRQFQHFFVSHCLVVFVLFLCPRIYRSEAYCLGLPVGMSVRNCNHGYSL